MPEPPWLEELVRFLTHPLVSPLLLSLAVLGVAFELKAGAFGLGGLVSLVALALFFGASYLQGLAGWQEALLLVIGLAALAIEILVLPGFGVTGVIGAVCITVAVVL
ncbi:MAG: nodulation protein NfeD, partial [Gemmatimonadota bacterium]